MSLFRVPLRHFILFLAVLLFALLAHAGDEQTLLVFGDSLSSGYRMDSGKSWPALLERKLQESGKAVRVVNASRKGETSEGGRKRLQDILSKSRPRWVILQLGANDGLRRKPLDALGRNLHDMLGMIRAGGAVPILVGMKLPPDFEPLYAADFSTVFARAAKETNSAYVPFLLQNVVGNPELFQADRLHPTVEAQPRLLEVVWPVLEPLLPNL